MNWLRCLKGRVRFKEPLREHTSFRVGGRVDFFIEPKNLNDLRLTVAGLKRQKVPCFIIGAGSNILADDNPGFAVIKLAAPAFKKVKISGGYLKAGAGAKLRCLVRRAREAGLAGIEFLSGIPGTVGGALMMNAGAWGSCVGDLVEEVEVMDYSGRRYSLDKSSLKFSYRKSNLGKYIILSARIKLSQSDKSLIRKKEKSYLLQRLKAQDNSYPNAGSVFKNPSGAGYSSGRMIELCGLKGRRIGGACISEKHANFILNRGGASVEDILELIKLAKREVRKRFGINLRTEIKIWVA